MQHRPLPYQPQRPATAHDRDVPVAPASVVVRPVGSQRRGRRDRDRGLMATVPAALPPVVRLASIYRTLGLRDDPFPLVARAASGNADLLPALAIQAGTLAAWMASPGEDGRLAIVSGPARSGRTTLLDAACDEAARSTGTSVHRAGLGTLDGPLTDSRFLRAIVMAFGAEPSSRNGLDLIRHIRDLVTAQVAAGEHPVLAIDGAELAGSRLDLLRALLTDATSTDGLHSGLRIVVTGTPECRDRILRRQALRDCLTLDVRIEPMTEAGLDAFIRERIAAVALDEPVHAGAGQLPPHTAEAFSPEAVALIAAWSGGVVGPAVELAGECLLEAIARGTRLVDRGIAHSVAREFTDRAREAARQQAASPFIVPAVQARLALPFTGEPGADEAISGSSRTTTPAIALREERR